MDEQLSEYEAFGKVALAGLVLVPGIIWAFKGRSAATVVTRAVVAGAVVTAAMLLESAMDRTASATLAS